MKQREVFQLEQLQKFNEGSVSRADVALLLNLSERTVTRKAKRIAERGLLGIKHGNCGQTPKNRTSPELKQKVCGLIRDRYFDFNKLHIQEYLRDIHHLEVSYMTLSRWCKEIRINKRAHHRKKMSVRKHRERLPQEGYLIQMDGSPHLYNLKNQWTLIAGIDDATSEIPYAEFFASEDTLSCMIVLQKLIERKGLPWGVYTDRAGWLAGGKRQHFGEFRRACEDLGIQVIFANSPQAKGRIERWFQFAQDRLVAEMRLFGIKDIRAANHYLQNEFLPQSWNERFTVQPRERISKYRELSDWVDLNEIFCMKDTRKVGLDHTFQWNGGRYQITNPPGCLNNQEVEIRTYQDLTQRIFFANHELMVQKIEVPLRRSSG